MHRQRWPKRNTWKILSLPLSQTALLVVNTLRRKNLPDDGIALQEVAASSFSPYGSLIFLYTSHIQDHLLRLVLPFGLGVLMPACHLFILSYHVDDGGGTWWWILFRFG